MKSASWTIVIVALWLIASPWALDYRDRLASADDVIVGIALWVTGMSAASNEGWPWHWLIVALGMWLVLAPWVLGRVNISPAVTNDATVGVVVIISAVIRWATIKAASHRNSSS
jgi:hypothetical protein